MHYYDVDLLLGSILKDRNTVQDFGIAIIINALYQIMFYGDLTVKIFFREVKFQIIVEVKHKQSINLCQSVLSLQFSRSESNATTTRLKCIF